MSQIFVQATIEKSETTGRRARRGSDREQHARYTYCRPSRPFCLPRVNTREQHATSSGSRAAGVLGNAIRESVVRRDGVCTAAGANCRSRCASTCACSRNEVSAMSDMTCKSQYCEKRRAFKKRYVSDN